MEPAETNYFDLVPCYLTVQNRDLLLLKANRRFREDFGEFEGRHCYQVYKRRSERCESCPVLRTFDDGLCHRSEERIRTARGREVSVIVYTSPILDEHGGVAGVIEMCTDITEIKRLQGQLRESQERCRLLFEQVPCYISIQDPDLRIVDANRRFRDAFGDHLGCKCYEIYKHRDEECEHCAVQNTFRDGRSHHREEVVTSVQGEQLNTLVYTAPIHDGDGTIRHVMEMSADITPIRRLQSQLESIGMLISSVSHGIKGLLTGLDGGTYLVNSGLQRNDPKRVTQGWEMVQRNIERIRGTVMNILYYAKEREPVTETAAARALAEEVCGVLADRARENRVELRCEAAEDGRPFEADPRALRALLVNLVENSIDACRVDSKKASHAVVVRARGEADAVLFEVEDNGIGMDRETREKAFSLFFSSKGAEGTGLGLFIANKIAQAHGGRIDVESEPDRGTRFVVRVPRARPATGA
ncbi:MAG: PAS domain-containing protein [Deltaproteobacteria bacterium]|nr:PAS domain-containing protein [Deltaproteobacteria bacterium]